MAHHADCLADIGREGFALLERYDRGGISAQVPKDQHNVFHNQVYRDAPVSSDRNLINRKKAAGKYKGGGVYRDAPVSSDENAINSKKAAEKYKGVVITEYYKKRFVGWRF